MRQKKYLLNVNQKEYLLNHNQEVWGHYRHMENMRNQYLGFYFTVLTGFSAYLSMYKFEFNNSIIGFSIVVFVFYILTLFTYYSIAKIKYVLSSYENMMETIKSKFLSNDMDLANKLSVRKIINPITKFKCYGIQFLAELLLSFFIIIIPIIYFLFVRYAEKNTDPYLIAYLKYFYWSPFVLMFVLMIFTFIIKFISVRAEKLYSLGDTKHRKHRTLYAIYSKICCKCYIKLNP